MTLTDARAQQHSLALVAALQAGQPAEALMLARAMTAVRDDVLALQILAQDAGQRGQFDAAADYYRRALRLAPADAGIWSGMAELQFAAGHREPALVLWDRVLAMQPGNPAALCGRARVLQSLSRVREAEQSFRQALTGDPGSVPARYGLAKLLLEAGRLEAAARLAGPLSRQHRDRPDVLQLVARIAVARGQPGAARAALATALAIPSLTPGQRAEMLQLMGEVLGELDRPAEAFVAAVAGKAILRDLFAERAGSREGEVAKLRRLAAWFGRADPDRWHPAPRLAARFDGEAAVHVVLVGFPRSGTTLLEQALAGHPRVSALEEAPTLADHYAEFLADDGACERLAQLSAGDADVWRARYWATVAAHGIDATGRVFVDKAPAGTLSLPLIAKLFPAAKLLFALRDPRDVVLSCLRTGFQMNAMTYAFTTLAETAACYDACMTMAERYRAVLPLDLIEVRHETLVDGFDAELARIAAFIGMTVEPAMRDVAATARARPVRTPSASQVRAGLNRRGLARWRDYAAELDPVLPVLQPWVERFGYLA